MRTLIRIVVGRVIQTTLGRWVLTIILLLIGLAGILAYPEAPPDQATGDLVTGIVFTALGLAMLVFTETGPESPWLEPGDEWFTPCQT